MFTFYKPPHMSVATTAMFPPDTMTRPPFISQVVRPIPHSIPSVPSHFHLPSPASPNSTHAVTSTRTTVSVLIQLAVLG